MPSGQPLTSGEWKPKGKCSASCPQMENAGGTLYASLQSCGSKPLCPRQHLGHIPFYWLFLFLRVALSTPSALLPHTTPQFKTYSQVLVSGFASRGTQMKTPSNPSFYLEKELWPFSFPKVSNISSGKGFRTCLASSFL